MKVIGVVAADFEGFFAGSAFFLEDLTD